MGVNELAAAVKSAVQKRVDEESKAKRGTIRGGKFCCGSKSYNFISAVDVDVSEGKKVWAQLSKSGNAIIVGA